MDGFIQISLKDMIDQVGEERVKSILSTFSCPMNKDVEQFLSHTAIEFAKQRIASTHLVFTSYKKELVLIGYYSLATKVINITRASLSKTLRKKVVKFSAFDSELKNYFLPAPLIAQLGKNFSNNYNKLITGDELLKLALDKVVAIQQAFSGKIVYLECEDKEKLIEFYSSNGFVNFGKRKLDRDETDKLSGDYLIQMLKYLSDT